MDLNQLDRTIDSLALATSNYVQVNDVNEVTVKMTEALARLVIARASMKNVSGGSSRTMKSTE